VRSELANALALFIDWIKFMPDPDVDGIMEVSVYDGARIYLFSPDAFKYALSFDGPRWQDAIVYLEPPDQPVARANERR